MTGSASSKNLSFKFGICESQLRISLAVGLQMCEPTTIHSLYLDAGGALPWECCVKSRIHLNSHTLHQSACTYIIQSIWLVSRQANAAM